jgi:hypothetical protein
MEDSDLPIPLVYHTIGMQILNARPKETSLRPVQQLIYKFMILPTSQSKYVVAYELEDEAPRTYLLEARQPGRMPPFSKLGDIMLVKKKMIGGMKIYLLMLLSLNSIHIMIT